MAGALERKLIGPIRTEGRLVTDVWLGAEKDPPAGGETDVKRAAILSLTAGLLFAALAIAAISMAWT